MEIREIHLRRSGATGQAEAGQELPVAFESFVAAERHYQSARQQDSCTISWERLELKCAYSRQPLTDPAKADSCPHRSCCNYDDLRAYAGRHKMCPSCSKAILRTRSIERDDELREALQRLPRATEVVWLRGSEVRTDEPPVGAASTARLEQQRKRAQADSRPAPASRRRSKRQMVVVL